MGSRAGLPAVISGHKKTAGLSGPAVFLCLPCEQGKRVLAGQAAAERMQFFQQLTKQLRICHDQLLGVTD